MARRKTVVNEPTWWLVQRVRGRDGKPLPRPTLAGRVLASSDTLAVEKFLSIVRVPQQTAAFEAVPVRGA